MALQIDHMDSFNKKDVLDFVSFFDEMYDFDFSGYSYNSLTRRLNRLLNIKGLDSLYDLRYELTNDHLSSVEVINEISVNVTEMFRDPEVFKFIQGDIFDYLGSFPQFKIWHAGCSSGEEVYSLAILLKEHNLLKKSIQFGTDLNTDVLTVADSGVYPGDDIKSHVSNYQNSGGQVNFSSYYYAAYGNVIMNKELKKNMVFSQHDLVKQTSFNEFQLILCRNVVIYFDNKLKERVFRLLVDSLCPYGYLVLGNKESLKFTNVENELEMISSKHKIYRKKAIV